MSQTIDQDKAESFRSNKSFDIEHESHVGQERKDQPRANDPVAEKRLLRKLDFWILPLLCLIYFVASMDRSDIGNAQVAGMQEDLGIPDSQWPQVTSMFYIGYIVCQPLGTIFLRKFTPPVILGFAVCCWGTLTVLLLTVKNVQSAIALRVLIGATEGLTQAAPFYMSIWYRGHELGARGAIVFSVSSLAGAFNGLIAYGVTLGYSDKPPFRPWQWLFLIEGCFSIGIGLIAFALLPPVPERVKFGLSPKEKDIAIQRSIEAYNTLDAKINVKKILPVFKKPVIWGLMGTYACLNFTMGSLSSFMPSMIKGMGYTSVDAQLMSVPVYTIGFVSTLFFGILSDRLKIRGYFILGLMSIILVGYIIIVAVHTPNVRYAGICIAAFGFYPCIPLTLAWMNNSVIGYTQRATAIAVINMVSQTMAIAANASFTDPPYYLKGTSANIGVLAAGVLIVLFNIFWMRRLNRTKVQNANTEKSEELRALSYDDIGCDHPDFYYTP
jgi:sugar phosphate permease